jgi:predicted helicase
MAAPSDDVNYVFPLWAAPEQASLLAQNAKAHPNFAVRFLESLAGSLGVKIEGSYSLPAGVTAEDIFHYAYAVFHSPGYRSRYPDFLKINFPRLPLTGNLV